MTRLFHLPITMPRTMMTNMPADELPTIAAVVDGVVAGEVGLIVDDDGPIVGLVVGLLGADLVRDASVVAD